MKMTSDNKITPMMNVKGSLSAAYSGGGTSKPDINYSKINEDFFYFFCRTEKEWNRKQKEWELNGIWEDKDGKKKITTSKCTYPILAGSANFSIALEEKEVVGVQIPVKDSEDAPIPGEDNVYKVDEEQDEKELIERQKEEATPYLNRSDRD
jgi:hypothetical protein